MSLNKLALIRYKTIDECLQNRYRNWTLEDLMDKVSDAIYEYEGIDSGISKRTIQADIQLMRSDKLGYNAPIIVKEKKYYTYEDKNYSISKTIFNDKNIEVIKESLEILKQFGDFALFEGVGDAILKLENKINNPQNTKRKFIQFEQNQQLKGLNFLMPLYQIIAQKKTINLSYQSFKAQFKDNPPKDFIIYPYLLKEYRNRWFLIGTEKNRTAVATFALDRIVNFEILPQEHFNEINIDFEHYYSNLIGVTKSEQQATEKVVLQVEKSTILYVLTKPLHASQKILQEFQDSTIISLDVVLNFELEKEILGFGEGIKVLSPDLLVQNMKRRLKKASKFYENNE